LADIPNPQISRSVIDRKSERVAQTVQPNLLRCRGVCNEGVIARNSECSIAGHLDSQHFAQARGQVLCVADRWVHVAAAPAVAQADVKKSVIAESQAAPIVICLRLIDRE